MGTARLRILGLAGAVCKGGAFLYCFPPLLLTAHYPPGFSDLPQEEPAIDMQSYWYELALRGSLYCLLGLIV